MYVVPDTSDHQEIMSRLGDLPFRISYLQVSLQTMNYVTQINLMFMSIQDEKGLQDLYNRDPNEIRLALIFEEINPNLK